MRVVAALPSIPLLAGTALGLLLTDPPLPLARCALIASTAVAGWCVCRARRQRTFAVAVATAFFVGGLLLSSVEWQRAWRPPLRVVFEEIARAQRAEAAAAGRRLPEDDEAFAIVEGTLRSDAALTEAGVSLSLAVELIDELSAGQEAPATPAVASHRSSVVSPRSPVPRPTTDDWRLATGGILVTVVGSLAAARADDWRAGRRVRMPVTLRRPSRYLNPGVPDHERDLARRGTTLVGSVKSGALVELVARAGWWGENLAAARAFARWAIAAGVGRWSAQSAAIVSAIVIGDRSQLDPEVQRRLQEAGTYHVIAISGGNIAILAGLLVWVFRVAGWLGRAAMVSAAGVLIVYAQFVGGGASVDRATLMAVVYLGARAVDLRSPPLNALAVVAATLVATDPLATVDPAFLLTFGATLAILAIVPSVGPFSTFSTFSTGPIGRPLTIAMTMVLASAAAEAVLFPIGALLFSRVTIAGLGLNLLAIPLMGIAQVAGMAVVPCALISGPLAALAGLIAHAGAAGLVWSAELLRFAPALTWRVAPPSWTSCAIYYAAFLVAWVAWRRRRTRTGSGESPAAGRLRVGATVIATAAAVWIAIEPRVFANAGGDGRLHVTFIDVGQGDAAFVVFPRGSTLLVDAGGLSFASSFDIGDGVVAPVIRSAGFRRLDRLALTHGDPDHIGGALAIVRELRPREVWEGIPVPRSELLTRLRIDAQSAGARWANVYAGDRVTIDGVEVVARHPGREDWERQKVRNEDSLVLELRWRDVSILLTGDIGRETERTLTNTIPPAPLRVVKIPHHGSLTSSTPAFVAALRPQVAVVSAGRTNHFGHPVPEVLGRYEAAGAKVFRTDRDGAVMVDSDGTAVDVRTITGRESPPVDIGLPTERGRAGTPVLRFPPVR